MKVLRELLGVIYGFIHSVYRINLLTLQIINSVLIIILYICQSSISYVNIILI